MKYLITFTFCVIHFFAQGQAYQKMLGESNKWVMEEVGFGFSVANEVTVTQDTIIDGIVYYVVDHSNAGNLWEFRGFLTEDTISRKIFFVKQSPRDSIHLETKELFYDFGMNIGDTALVKTFIYGNIPLILDSITHSSTIPQRDDNPFTVAPDSFKVFTLHAVNTSISQRFFWIEGIGTEIGIYPQHWNNPVTLKCLTRDDTTVLMSQRFTYNDTCYEKAIAQGGMISIDQNINPLFHLHQSPTQLILRFDDPFDSPQVLQLLDLQGRLIQQTALQPAQHEIEIEISQLPPSMYVIRLSGDGKEGSRKFVKR